MISSLRLVTLTLVASLSFVSCTQPDTPSNAAINLAGALQQGDEEEAVTLMCAAITAAAEVDLDAPETMGALGAFYTALSSGSGRSLSVGDSEYSTEEELELEASGAWVEIELGRSAPEVWRLMLVDERGGWRVCAAEQQL